ncbi:MAG: DUF1854 domain-containing protein, partial [Chloroflexi bacterium]|nr:DUF1854 domain-containing protein [Chloroflexota bacterium]
PLHHPNEFISVLINPDHELLLLDDLTDLDAESQRAIRQSLDWFYTVPTITRVHSLSYKLGPMYWRVETSHGEREFVLYWSSEHIVELPSGEVRLIDVSGNRYTLPESGSLDEKSRALIREALI